MKMRIRIGKRRKIQFTDKKHPFAGIVSMLIAYISLIFMAALCISSGMERGHGGILYGYLGIVNLILSSIGFILSLRCYKKEDVYMTTPAIGSLLNGIIIILCLILYFQGAL